MALPYYHNQNVPTAENDTPAEEVQSQGSDESRRQLVNDPGSVTACEHVLKFISIFLVVILLPFSLLWVLQIVKQYKRAVVLRLGRFLPDSIKGPGIIYILPCIDEVIMVDLRTVTYDVPTQEVLTKDSVTIWVDAIVYYTIVKPKRAVMNIYDYRGATQFLAATTLRNVIGTNSLTDILTRRDSMSHVMQSILDKGTARWGVYVDRVEIKDVRLPIELQRAMATEAESTREARAKIIAADGELQASKALKEASMVISESPAALQLRYLQTLNSVAGEKSSTIIFPLPIEILQAFGKRKDNGTFTICERLMQFFIILDL